MKPRKSTRNLRNSSGRRENNTLDLVDRISALPDSILGLIISNLPTKNAVATTILSKRWKLVWTNVHNLDFCFEHWEIELPEEEDMKFARFVNHVLLLHGGGFLNKFRLLWGPRFIPTQVSSWINTAITRNVHQLFLCVEGHPHFEYWDESIREPLEMPISLFSCGSLQSLKLNGSISVPAEIVVCLPRLESLMLGSVYFQSEEAFEKLISGCPVLNYLHLHIDMQRMVTYSEYPVEFKFIISSTSLRRLELLVRPGDLYPNYSLQLEASSLEYFKLEEFTPQVFVQGTLSSLVAANFGIRFQYDSFSEDECNTVVEAVRAFDCAKALTLSVGALWALRNATICLPKFRRLTKLEAGVHCTYCSSWQDFIQRCDNLEILAIFEDWLDESVYHDYSKWIAPVEVPRCLSNSLKAVAFKDYGLKAVAFNGYGCYDDEREMIHYMLKHGSVLEVLQVTYNARNSKKVYFELVKEIRKFPRKSPACKFELSVEPIMPADIFPFPWHFLQFS